MRIDRARLRLRIAVLLVISAANIAILIAFDVRVPLVIYNASGSAPLGFYYVEDRLPTRGELALIKPPPLLELMIVSRGILPPSVPLVKQVTALGGDEVCRSNEPAGTIAVNGKVVAEVFDRDRGGRRLPSWDGCIRLRAERPDISGLLLNGFQAASFPITARDFHAVMDLLGEPLDELPSPADHEDTTADQLAALERKYLHASPEVKTRVSKSIERGSVGRLVKKMTGFKCQVCAALGHDPIGFLKKGGEPYVEAHHVMPVSTKQVGSLSASNVMTVCANHHRQLHYGGIDVTITDASFDLVVSDTLLKIPRLVIGKPDDAGIPAMAAVS